MTTVCIGAHTLYWPELGGHVWPYLNWALGARANGCRVLWLEGVSQETPPDEVARLLDALKENLRPYGLDDSIVLCPWTDDPLPSSVAALSLDLEDAFTSDAFIDLIYSRPATVVERFTRSALINIDPGLLESWMRDGTIRLTEHDLYFTTGQRAFDGSRRWEPTLPCASLDVWTLESPPSRGAFTTVTGWYANEWITVDGEPQPNDKRTGYLPFLDVPRLTAQKVELATDLGEYPESEEAMLRSKGWIVRRAADVAGSPQEYQRYIRSSLGEFSCCKPSCVYWESGWISDRTVCYLASGRPAVIQDTGPNPALDGGAGILRFRTPAEAAACLDRCANGYAEHARAARDLAEDLFDARKVVGRLLERII